MVRRVVALALLALVAACAGDDERAPLEGPTDDPGRIAFAFNVRGDSDIYVMRPDGAGRRNLTRSPRVDEDAPAWSPDGELLAFVSVPADEDGWEASDVWVMRADGTERRRLTDNNEPDVAPRWTVDGRIVFTSCARRGDEFPECSLEALRPNGRGRETLVRDLGFTFGADLSPEGTTLAYTPIRSEADYARPTIVLRELDGGGERALVKGRVPRWSPDGRRIAFTSDRDGNGRCLFHDCVGSAHEIYVIDANGGNQRRLTRHPALDTSPSWTPDGSQLVFSRIPDEDSDHDLYVVDADGTHERALTDTPHWEVSPDWHRATGVCLETEAERVTIVAGC